MSAIFRPLICVLLLAFALSGCYNTPVRHLASDAALIKPGVSTRNDVLTFLGEPDEQIVVGGGVEKWLFREYEHSAVKDAPLVGKYFGKSDYGTVTVTLKDNVVVECVYGAWEDNRDDWADDFSWQKEKNK